MAESPPFFVTIATQRSGTKFFGTALSAGGVIRSLGEIFQPGAPAAFGRFFASYLRQRESFAFEAAELIACLDAFIARLRQAVAPARLHFDLMYNTLGALAPIWTPAEPPPEGTFLLRWLKARRAGVIHLLRPDLAHCVASHAIAAARNLYHTGNARHAATAGLRLRLDPREAEVAMRAIRRGCLFVRRAFHHYPHYLEIAYPDFIAGTTVAAEVAQRIAALGGIAEADRLFGHSPLRPTAPDKAALIDNWEEIQALAARIAAEEPA